MNFKQFGSLLPDNPLCRINTYKDTLNLANGACTRRVKKVVLDGTETVQTITDSSLETGTKVFGYYYTALDMSDIIDYNISMPIINYPIFICSHFTEKTDAFFSYKAIKNGEIGANSTAGSNNAFLIFASNQYTTEESWKSWLAQQYANGTPVTVWYILATPTTETITVPTGLSGTEVGYLNQSGTPTPTNPIYPTANEVKVWHDIPYYIHNTSTDTITTLPADIYANDTTATVGLKGQMVQSGTPTPTTPIQPQECGERTKNVMPSLAASTETKNGVTCTCDGNGKITIQGTASAFTQFVWTVPEFTIPISVGQGGSGTFSMFNTFASTAVSLVLYNDTTQVDNWTFVSINRTNTSYSAMGGKQVNRILLNVSAGTTVNGEFSLMFTNDGVLPSEFEPYGYKIPILSNSTTTPVYLGETQTTRKIGKYVFTGEESITRSVSYDNVRMYYVISNAAGASPLYCTHFVDYAQAASYPPVGYCNFNNVSNFIMGVDGTAFETANDFKTWLAQQYAAGTPVTVWYVLSEPTTGIVNEPLRKIGDYADEVSNITIPTIAGANAIDVLTTLKPSEVSVNYHGWHPVSAVHERESGQWD